MEIRSCKSSTHDESKISIHVSDVSDVSAALRRLAFLPDTCIRRRVRRVSQRVMHVIRMKRLIHEKYNTRAKRANVLKALSRLAFCISTCAGHVLHVLNTLHMPHMSHMSQALRRLAFLRDMCLGHMSHMSRVCYLQKHVLHVRHVRKALRRLAFLYRTCVRQRAACATHAELH